MKWLEKDLYLIHCSGQILPSLSKSLPGREAEPFGWQRDVDSELHPTLVFTQSWPSRQLALPPQLILAHDIGIKAFFGMNQGRHWVWAVSGE